MPVGIRRSLSFGVVGLCVLVAGLVFGSVQALAAPATPEVRVEAVTATTATFQGVLSPNAPGELGSTYQFLYRISKTECKGQSKAPESPGMSLGGENEGVAEPVSGLVPNTGYAVCLHIENAAKTEEAVSSTAHFVTGLEAPETLAAEPVGVTTATLKGVLSPNATVAGEPASYEFRYRQSATECQGGEPEEYKATPATGASGSRQEAEVPVTGLLPGTQYTFCLLERNAAKETAVGPAVTFTTHGAGITEEQTTSVEATAATLQADIDPNELNTSYHFEYDTTPYTSSAPHGTSLPVPSEAIGSGTSRVPVSVRLTGLQPGITYYYRVVAVDEIETFDGAGKALTTLAVPGSGSSGGCPNEQLRAEQPYGLELPDCRAYELVSPAEKNGNDATEADEFPGRAAASGEAVEFRSWGSFAGPVGNKFRNEYISRRGPEGWSTQSIEPPSEVYNTNWENAYESMAFTPELSKGVVETNAQLASGAPVGRYAVYLDDFASDSYQWLSDAPNFEMPFSESEPLHVVASSPDLSDVIFRQDWLWVEGKSKPILLDIANNGEAMGGTAGSGGNAYEWYVPNTWHAVSSNGSRIFFTSPVGRYGEEGQLYVRENAGEEQSPVDGDGRCTVPTDACTVEISASQKTNGTGPGGGDPNGPQPARYWGANTDGSKVFFTSSAELTDDAYTGTTDNAANLYEYDFERSEGERLKDLTVDTGDVAEGAAVQGLAQISEDGSYVYFVAKGDLAGAATSGAPNLYVSHEGDAPVFIATLTEETLEREDWARFSFFVGGPIDSTAVVSPDGTRLAFMSHRSLTGYDNVMSDGADCGINPVNHAREEPPACDEVFEYDALTDQLVCASCDPSGARPTGPASLDPEREFPFVQYRSRNFAENGTLFFQSPDALVPHASDGRQNVYEYEAGHIYAISNVAGGQNSFFLDASANGNNVFLATADQLVAQDRDNRVDVYDARVDGGFPASVSPPPCDNGDSCKPPASPQPAVFGAPASATFSGAGNPAPVAVVKPMVKPKARPVTCRKGLVKKKSKCVKRVKPRKAKKSTHGRGSR